MTPIAPTAIALTGDRQITLTRRFAAPPRLSTAPISNPT